MADAPRIDPDIAARQAEFASRTLGRVVTASEYMNPDNAKKIEDEVAAEVRRQAAAAEERKAAKQKQEAYDAETRRMQEDQRRARENATFTQTPLLSSEEREARDLGISVTELRQRKAAEAEKPKPKPETPKPPPAVPSKGGVAAGTIRQTGEPLTVNGKKVSANPPGYDELPDGRLPSTMPPIGESAYGTVGLDDSGKPKRTWNKLDTDPFSNKPSDSAQKPDVISTGKAEEVGDQKPEKPTTWLSDPSAIKPEMDPDDPRAPLTLEKLREAIRENKNLSPQQETDLYALEKKPFHTEMLAKMQAIQEDPSFSLAEKNRKLDLLAAEYGFTKGADLQNEAQRFTLAEQYLNQKLEREHGRVRDESKDSEARIKREIERRDKTLAENDDVKAKLDKLYNEKVDPYSGMSMPQRIIAAIGLIGAGIAGGPNGARTAMGFIEEQIRNNVTAQVETLKNKKGALNDKAKLLKDIIEESGGQIDAAGVLYKQQLLTHAKILDGYAQQSKNLDAAKRFAAAAEELRNQAETAYVSTLGKNNAEVAQERAAAAAAQANAALRSRKEAREDLGAAADADLKRAQAEKARAEAGELGNLTAPVWTVGKETPDLVPVKSAADRKEVIEASIAHRQADKAITELIDLLKTDPGYFSKNQTEVESRIAALKGMLNRGFKFGALDAGADKILGQMIGNPGDFFRRHSTAITTLGALRTTLNNNYNTIIQGYSRDPGERPSSPAQVATQAGAKPK